MITQEQIKELKELMQPMTLIQKVVFGILAAKEVCKDEEWSRWADNWLSGEDRSAASAQTAKDAAAAKDADAAWAAAADAARSAALAAEAAYAAWAAYWAAWAAYAAAAKKPIDLISLAEQAMAVK